MIVMVRLYHASQQRATSPELVRSGSRRLRNALSCAKANGLSDRSAPKTSLIPDSYIRTFVHVQFTALSL